jgi:hypothetical protein
MEGQRPRKGIDEEKYEGKDHEGRKGEKRGSIKRRV